MLITPNLTKLFSSSLYLYSSFLSFNSKIKNLRIGRHRSQLGGLTKPKVRLNFPEKLLAIYLGRVKEAM